ncbi:MAG: hypothetical protein HYX56_05140 [Chloroflexi bacterium]|nr:hypothetical protein [Chloroflexota bacterium]
MFIWAIVAGSIAAFAAGFLAAVISNSIFLVVLFPALMGMATGGVFALAYAGRPADAFSARNVIIAASLGIMAYASMFVFSYMSLSTEVRASRTAPAELRDLTLFRYLQFRADATTLGRVGTRPSGSGLGGAAYALWLGEAAIAGYAASRTYRRMTTSE